MLGYENVRSKDDDKFEVDLEGGEGEKLYPSLSYGKNKL